MLPRISAITIAVPSGKCPEAGEIRPEETPLGTTARYIDGMDDTLPIDAVAPLLAADEPAPAERIRTDAGLVLHTGDFKMDQLPLDGRITDLRSFARLGEEGVDLFMTDSTNAEVPGFTALEKDIGPVLENLFGG